MRTKLLAIFAGTLVLMGTTVANADELVPLTDAQLDNVTAGDYVVLGLQPGSNLLGGQIVPTRQEANAIKNDLKQDGYKVKIVERF